MVYGAELASKAGELIEHVRKYFCLIKPLSLLLASAVPGPLKLSPLLVVSPQVSCRQ